MEINSLMKGSLFLYTKNQSICILFQQFLAAILTKYSKSSLLTTTKNNLNMSSSIAGGNYNLYVHILL